MHVASGIPHSRAKSAGVAARGSAATRGQAEARLRRRAYPSIVSVPVPSVIRLAGSGTEETPMFTVRKSLLHV